MRFFFLSLILAVLGSCTTVYVGSPRVNKQTETAERPVPKSSNTSYTLASEPETAIVSDEVITTPGENAEPIENTQLTPSAATISTVLHIENDDTTGVATEEEQAIYDEAMRSEQTAKAAQVFSYMPLGTFLLPLSLFVGVIGTIVCLVKFKKYEYVTEEAIRRKKKAIRTVIICALIPLAVVLSIVALSLIII